MERKCCPRCGHLNEPRARFCAHCGLKLPPAEPRVENLIRENRRRTRTWLLVLLALAGLVWAANRSSGNRCHFRRLVPVAPTPRVITPGPAQRDLQRLDLRVVERWPGH